MRYECVCNAFFNFDTLCQICIVVQQDAYGVSICQKEVGFKSNIIDMFNALLIALRLAKIQSRLCVDASSLA